MVAQILWYTKNIRLFSHFMNILNRLKKEVESRFFRTSNTSQTEIDQVR